MSNTDKGWVLTKICCLPITIGHTRMYGLQLKGFSIQENAVYKKGCSKQNMLITDKGLICQIT